MGQEITSSHFDRRDFNRFEHQLKEETALLETWFAQQQFSNKEPMVGLELEAWLLDNNLSPSPSNQPFLDTLNHPLVVPELASFNVEINNAPHPLLQGSPFSNLHSELDQTWQQARRAAESMELQMGMIGILPTIEEPDLSLDNMSRMQRYRALNEQVMRMRKGQPLHFRIEGRETLSLDHQDVMMEAAATSLQIHLKVPLQQSVTAFNNAIRLSAPMVALCANAPYLFGKELWDDSRIPLFEQAVNVNPLGHRLGEGRVSFGTGYAHKSLLELFQENRDHYPVMLPIDEQQPTEALAHLLLHNGTIWRWNRPLVGFDGDGTPHLRIEHRVASAGPTTLDVVANTLFFIGTMMGMLQQPARASAEISFTQAKDNFYRAASYGLDSAVRWGNRRVYLRELLLLELLPLAETGLKRLELPTHEWRPWLELIEGRIRSGQNGARWQRHWVAAHGLDLQGLTADYLHWQDSGNPIHQWPISG